MRNMIDPRFPWKMKRTRGATSSTPLPEPVFLNTSGGVNFGMKAERDLQRPPTERVFKNEGKLAPITDNVINLEAVMAMDTSGYLDPLSILTDVTGFKSHIVGPLPTRKKVSRFMLRHAADLQAFKTMERPAHALYYAMPVFTTPKKSGELRVVQDCTYLNKIFDRPPKMDLPLIHELIEEVLKHGYMGQADGVSYFYQFLMSARVAAHFGVRMGGARGEYLDLVMSRMPMGWSWAPCIGQRTANVLIRGLGKAWVDNFIVLGLDMDDFTEKAATFLRRTTAVNLELDKKEIVGETHGVAVGVEFDLVKKLYRMDPDWIPKAVDRIEAILAQGSMTVLDLYTVAGTLIWRHHVMRYELCHVPHILAGVGRAARDISGGAAWTSVATVTPEMRAEIKLSLEILRENAWRAPCNTPEPTVDVWSDASDKHWAFLLFAKDILVAARQGETAGDHIFYSELSVALGGLSAAHRLGHSSARSHIDNAAAAGALQRGASSNFRANRWLSGKLIEKPEVHWVSTREMLADPYRGVARHRCHSLHWARRSWRRERSWRNSSASKREKRAFGALGVRQATFLRGSV